MIRKYIKIDETLGGSKNKTFKELKVGDPIYMYSWYYSTPDKFEQTVSGVTKSNVGVTVYWDENESSEPIYDIIFVPNTYKMYEYTDKYVVYKRQNDLYIFATDKSDFDMLLNKYKKFIEIANKDYHKM